MLLISTIVSAVLHEFGHAWVAHSRGYMLKKLVIMPFGAVLYGAENLQKKDTLAISLAGPAVNLILVSFIYAMWWIAPITHNYTVDFLYANLGILFFNLLPIYPLDGGRVLLAISKNPIKMQKILRHIGVVFAGVLLILFVASAFFSINFSLIMLAIMLYISSTSKVPDDNYIHIANNATLTKNFQAPIKIERYILGDHLQLIELLKLVKSSHCIKVDIVCNNSLTPYATLTESDIAELCMHFPIRTKLHEVLKNPHKK